jgi:predicted small integral membrane protein
MLNWVHPMWQFGVGLGIFLAFIPAIAFINVKWALQHRRGFLSMETTLGLRFFIGAIAFIYIHLLWLLIVPNFTIIIPFIISLALLFATMKWG